MLQAPGAKEMLPLTPVMHYCALALDVLLASSYKHGQRLGESSFPCIKCLENGGSLCSFQLLLACFVNLTISEAFHLEWNSACLTGMWWSSFPGKYTVVHRQKEVLEVQNPLKLHIMLTVYPVKQLFGNF